MSFVIRVTDGAVGVGSEPLTRLTSSSALVAELPPNSTPARTAPPSRLVALAVKVLLTRLYAPAGWRLASLGGWNGRA
jgi:hypothetical protein